MAREKLLLRLEKAFARIKLLTGLLPICAFGKKIRDQSGDWVRLESRTEDKTDAQFTHRICPECRKKIYPPHPDPRGGGEGTGGSQSNSFDNISSHRLQSGGS